MRQRSDLVSTRIRLKEGGEEEEMEEEKEEEQEEEREASLTEMILLCRPMRMFALYSMWN